MRYVFTAIIILFSERTLVSVYTQALDLFLEQESIMGPSSALCENIGHTQSSLGMLKDAEASFEKGATDSVAASLN